MGLCLVEQPQGVRVADGYGWEAAAEAAAEVPLAATAHAGWVAVQVALAVESEAWGATEDQVALAASEGMGAYAVDTVATVVELVGWVALVEVTVPAAQEQVAAEATGLQKAVALMEEAVAAVATAVVWVVVLVEAQEVLRAVEVATVVALVAVELAAAAVAVKAQVKVVGVVPFLVEKVAAREAVVSADNLVKVRTGPVVVAEEAS